MKEYTVISIISVFAVIGLDAVSGVNILKRKEYYFFLFIIACFMFFVNGYLTGSDIVRYNQNYFLGIRLGSIPLEDFLFGFSMVTLTIMMWESCKRRKL